MKRSLEAGAKQSASKRKPAWQMVLYKCMHDKDKQVFTDDLVIVIRDQYPKVRRFIKQVHVLLCRLQLS